MSAADHLAEAQRHDHQAQDLAERRVEPGEPSVTMAGLDTVSTSSGEPLVRPRWTSSVSPTVRHRHEVDRLRRHAAEHRRIANGMLDAEKRACQGLTEDEIALGPFFHSDDIERVESLEREGQVMGARVRFRDVPDLSAEWMRRAVSCTQARAAALGYPRDDVHASPLFVRGVEAEVVQRGAFIEVEIKAKDAEVGLDVVERARASVRPATGP